MSSQPSQHPPHSSLLAQAPIAFPNLPVQRPHPAHTGDLVWEQVRGDSTGNDKPPIQRDRRLSLCRCCLRLRGGAATKRHAIRAKPCVSNARVVCCIGPVIYHEQVAAVCSRETAAHAAPSPRLCINKTAGAVIAVLGIAIQVATLINIDILVVHSII